MFKRFIKLENEDKKIWYWGFIILTIIVIIQYKFGVYYPNSFWTSLLPNFFADGISILITTYLLANILEKREVKKKKKDAYMIFAEKYNSMVNLLALRYIWHITKIPHEIHMEKLESEISNENKNTNEQITIKKQNNDMYKVQDKKEITNLLLNGKVKFKNSKEEKTFTLNSRNYVNKTVRYERDYLKQLLEGVVKNINIHIGEDFLIKRYQEVNLKLGRDYREFGKMFKERSLDDIKEFKDMYMQFFPTDLLISITRLENYFNIGIVYIMDWDSVEHVYLEKTSFNLNEFREIFSKMGEEIIFLIDYFEEYKDH